MAPANQQRESGAPRYPRLSDVPDRPQGLPTGAELAERRRRLEADRAEATVLDPRAGPAAAPEPVPEPLPELAETLRERSPEVPPTDAAPVGRAGVSVRVATLYFPGDSGDLDDQMIAVLRQVAREQQAIGGTVRVVGYRAVAAIGDALAHRQMAAIGDTLVRLGVPPTRIAAAVAEETQRGGDGDHGHAVIYLDY